MAVDVGLCVEFTVCTKDEKFPVIYRPTNLQDLTRYLQKSHIEQLYEEYNATHCELTHIYVKGDNADTLVEFYLGNEEVPIVMIIIGKGEI